MSSIAGTLLEADLVRASLGPIFLVCLGIILYLGKNTIGRILMTIGVLHVGGGAIVGREPIARIFREGFLGEGDSALGNVPVNMEKELAFWFMLWGAYVFVIGQLAARLASEGKHVPERVGWQLIVTNLVAAAMVPKGGFWLCLIPAIMMVRHARRASKTASRAV